MKGLFAKFFVVMCVCLVEAKGEDVQQEWSFFTYPQLDTDINLIQKFLLFSIDHTLNFPDCLFTYDCDGKLMMHGPEKMVCHFALSFNQELKKVMKKGISRDRFEELKCHFISSLGEATFERDLAQKMNWEMVQDTCEFLQHAQPFIALDQNVLGREIKNAPVSQGKKTQAYYQLRLTAEDQKNISKIIKNLGELGWWDLMKKKKVMEKLGDQINPVHPLRFLGFVMSTPSLKKQMPKIMRDPVKKHSFLNGYGEKIGFAQRMTKELNESNMQQYVPGFCQQIKVPQESVQKYFSARDWKGLIGDLYK